MRVQSLGGEEPQEDGMETHSSILAWRIPWTEEPGRLQSMGSQESGMTERLNNTDMYTYIQKDIILNYQSGNEQQ